MYLINERRWQNLSHETVVHYSMLLYPSLLITLIRALFGKHRNVFQPMCLEFLPRGTKAQSEEERGGWEEVVKIMFRPGAKP